MGLYEDLKNMYGLLYQEPKYNWLDKRKENDYNIFREKHKLWWELYKEQKKKLPENIVFLVDWIEDGEYHSEFEAMKYICELFFDWRKKYGIV